MKLQEMIIFISWVHYSCQDIADESKHLDVTDVTSMCLLYLLLYSIPCSYKKKKNTTTLHTFGNMFIW